MTEKLLVTYAEAAEMLSVSERTVRRLAANDDIALVNLGKRCPRIVVESIHEYAAFTQQSAYNNNRGKWSVSDHPDAESNSHTPKANPLSQYEWNRPTPLRHTLTPSTSERSTATALPVRAASCCARHRSFRNVRVVIAATLFTSTSAEFSVDATEA